MYLCVYPPQDWEQPWSQFFCVLTLSLDSLCPHRKIFQVHWPHPARYTYISRKAYVQINDEVEANEIMEGIKRELSE